MDVEQLNVSGNLTLGMAPSEDSHAARLVDLKALASTGGTGGFGGGSISVNSTETVALTLESGVLEATVALQTAMTPNRGQLGADSSGIFVALGTSGSSAAAGDHTHPAVSTSAAGFMTPAMLELLNQGTTSGVVLAGNGVDVLSTSGEGGRIEHTVSVDTTENFIWSGTHTFGEGVQAKMNGTGGQIVLDTDDMILKRGTGSDAIDWGNSTLKGTSGTSSVTALNWQSQTLHDDWLDTTEPENRVVLTNGKIGSRQADRGTYEAAVNYMPGDFVSYNWGAYTRVYIVVKVYTSVSIEADLEGGNLYSLGDAPEETAALAAGHGIPDGAGVSRDTGSSSGWVPKEGAEPAQGVQFKNKVYMRSGEYAVAAHGLAEDTIFYRDPDTGSPSTSAADGTRQALFMTPSANTVLIFSPGVPGVLSGPTGTSGTSGTAGTSATSGTSGTAGTTGTAGTSATSGTSGTTGA